MLFDKEGKEALVRLLPSCGGTMAGMWYLAKLIRDSDSMDIVETLGEETLNHPDSAALLELMATCEQVNGKLDLEGILTHFGSHDHLHKFDRVGTAVAAELPEELRPVAHTLLPLTLVGGKYFYENGDATVEFRGLVQLGPSLGAPYAHLASLIWIEDGGLSATILDRQLHDGVAGRAVHIQVIDYAQAPLLTKATVAAKEALGI